MPGVFSCVAPVLAVINQRPASHAQRASTPPLIATLIFQSWLLNIVTGIDLFLLCEAKIQHLNVGLCVRDLSETLMHTAIHHVLTPLKITITQQYINHIYFLAGLFTG